ncbi:MAG: VWA domain-containing protein [Phycisphaerales bacterium]
MKRTHCTLALSILLASGMGSVYASPEILPSVTRCGTGNIQAHQPEVEVVFVLDTTGSMGGLIEGAKQKIWSIASKIAQAQPAPKLKMGLVGYRDRGDAYITKRTALTDDLDTVYKELMDYQAGGGGDTPESVNQALYESIERFDWSEDSSTLRIVFLVGDAPPQMEYEDDVKYQASCKLASERGIMINTVQCGNLAGTKDFWTKISALTNGQYAAIDQDSGVQRITTPYDQEITELDQELTSLMIDYGSSSDRAAQHNKREIAADISKAAAPEALADRAYYNQTSAGRANLYGSKELVDDVINNKVDLDEIKQEELPEEFKGKITSEVKEIITKNHEQRVQIQAKLRDLNALRIAHQEQVLSTMDADGFDSKVLQTLELQGASIGLRFHSTDSAPDSSEPTKALKSTDLKD